MRKRIATIGAALAALVFPPLAATSAMALSLVTFVSGQGVNTGTCAAPTTPCRTLQYALGQTVAGGEIKALDAANYSAVTINKSISITGVEGASVIRNTAGNAIAINAGANGVVTLSGLTIDGFNRTASYGVFLTSAASLTIKNCALRNFANDGISLKSSNGLKFLISHTDLTDNGASGLYVETRIFINSARGVLDHVAANKNFNGIWLSGATIPFTEVSVDNSNISNNANNGLTVAGPVLHLSGSTVQLNTYGVKVDNGQAKSAGNNAVSANVIDVDPAGALTNSGLR